MCGKRDWQDTAFLARTKHTLHCVKEHLLQSVKSSEETALIQDCTAFGNKLATATAYFVAYLTVTYCCHCRPNNFWCMYWTTLSWVLDFSRVILCSLATFGLSKTFDLPFTPSSCNQPSAYFVPHSAKLSPPTRVPLFLTNPNWKRQLVWIQGLAQLRIAVHRIWVSIQKFPRTTSFKPSLLFSASAKGTRKSAACNIHD